MLSCLTECPYGWIQDANKNCTHCIKNCETCLDLTNSNCPKCAATYFRYETSFCLEICPTKYFGNTSNYVCEPCDVSCQECTGASSSECTTCAPSFYTFDEPPKIMCYLECPGAYFGNLNWICQDCHFSCSICDGPLNSNCSQCSSDYFLFNHTTCLRDCPEGFYKNSQTKTCDNCDVSCKSCNGPLTQNCLSCPSEKYLLTDEFNNLYCLN
jgi:proprotein convertase subtilisin/kexin type 5